MNSENILFIQTAFPGDAILSLPALSKLKDFYPGCKIDVLCIPSTEEIFAASPSVDRAIVIDKKNKHKSFINTYRFIKKLKQNNYSRIYSSHRSFRTSFIVLLLEVRETFGFDNSSFMHVYKNLIEYKSERHEVQRNFDLVGFVYDEQSWKITPEVTCNEKSREKIKLFIDENDLSIGFIAIAPGSIWDTKKYPSDYYKDVIKYFVDKNIKVILIGGEDDRAAGNNISSIFSGNVLNTAGNFSIVESIELLRYAKLLISNDSAPTHMGMCADIQVLTIYCSTVPEFGFYPYNKKSSFLSFNDLNCKPCGIHGYDKCPIKTFDCAKKLLPGQVILKVKEMLND
jgi:heptosyltransferase-2